MKDVLCFPQDQYEKKILELEGRTIAYRAFTGLSYCAAPKDPIQKLNLVVPEPYYHGESIESYTRETAPIFIPNTVGGYMPGPREEPGIDTHTGKLNSLFQALAHGFVAVSPGIRGRTTGKSSDEFFEGSREGSLGEASGKMTGRAPALIVDLKAVIRYLRYNRERIPGNTERIITNGTSAGGALSALAGASGNSPDYEEDLRSIGAAEERDDIFAANCYCPIHNLEHADSAYEWQFSGWNEYHRIKHQRTEHGIIRVPDDGVMTEAQITLSNGLKNLFPPYVNSLGLKDEEGNPLTLDAQGEGSFREYVKKQVIRSAELEKQTHRMEQTCSSRMTPGSRVDEQTYLVEENGHITDLDWDGYISAITRMKAAPAFDGVDLRNPENEEFGDEETDARHFTAFSMEHSTVKGAELAKDSVIRKMNPTCFIGEADTAPHWWIRHGAYDRDTSLAIPLILSVLLKNHGFDTDTALPWGMPHSGDYDLDELFAWIDSICR